MSSENSTVHLPEPTVSIIEMCRTLVQLRMPEIAGHVLRLTGTSRSEYAHQIARCCVNFGVGPIQGGPSFARDVRVELYSWMPASGEVDRSFVPADIQAILIRPTITALVGGLWHPSRPRYDVEVTVHDLRRAIRPADLRLAAAMELPAGVVYVVSDGKDGKRALMRTRFTAEVPEADRPSLLNDATFPFSSLEQYLAAQSAGEAVQESFYTAQRVDTTRAEHRGLRAGAAA